ncbi:HelD family protein [Nigerium massiliense]|uniref:HelD family protein n=1 Tax=Nigerium massiliense TaxID=1522317 RepID=UPI00058C290C|nr:ATP-binding domain-containing protein [Nigerium massiliense]
MPEPVLDAERAHLEASRAALKQMRAETSRGFEHAVAGNAVSAQHLKQVLYRRMRALEDDPGTPLFFGRLDYDRDLGAELDETLYIGRRHVSGELGGDPLVMDWRADMAVPFYRASATDPMGVRLRRRFGFNQGVLTAYEDEDLTRTQETSSRLLQAEIERPRTGPMRDIVATIQPDQDVLVRTDLAESICIQGAPGTGKTAVGLHRAAYLLYQFRSQLARSGVLVVGPNENFLSYIGDVLPALGEIDARQETLETLLADATGARVRAEDAPAVATLKGDARLADVLERAVWGQLVEPTDGVTVPRGSRQLRLSAGRVAEAVEALRGMGARYETGRTLLPQRLAHAVLLQLEALGDSTDDRVQNSVAKTSAVKKACAAVWPVVKPAALLHRLFSDPAFLAESADGILDADEQRALLWVKRPRTPGSARWSLADLVLLDELADLFVRTPSLGHVIVDEAQDLSAMALRAVGRRASTGSMTLLGDLAQATTAWGVTDWADALTHAGVPQARLTELVEGFRVPGQVIDYAARLLPAIAPGLTPPRSVRHNRGELALRAVEDPIAALADAVAELLGREGTVGVIVPDADADTARAALTAAGIASDDLAREHDFAERVEIVPASLAKGLEFDHVVLADPAGLVAAEPDETTGLRRLYVCLTRAVTSLVVLHRDDLPALLGEEGRRAA